MEYEEFISKKTRSASPVGFESTLTINPALFPFQRDCVRWALRRGRSCIFADCGLGKTAQQLEWARHVVYHTNGKILILAPLAVSQQTIREGQKFGVEVTYARDQFEVRTPITITNYERLEGFDPKAFSGVVLDESSILKAFTGKTRTRIIESFANTPFRLACTATPAPNDFTELGNHAAFLGIMTYAEMLSMYFVHDGGSTQDWKLKGHAETAFWRWVCSWAVFVRRPSDLGYEDGAFTLPPLNIHEHVVPIDHVTARKAGMLFKMEAITLNEQREARRSTIAERAAKCAEIIALEPNEPWLVWCDLNAEGDLLEKLIPGAVQVAGADDPNEKAKHLLDFGEGRIHVLVTKSKIAGWGMNYQHCARIAYVGLSNSYEQIYQTTRRCWRFGQTRSVDVHMIIAETEGRVAANVRRKEKDAAKMGDQMAVHMRDVQEINVRGTVRQQTAYLAERAITIPSWLTAAALEKEDAT